MLGRSTNNPGSIILKIENRHNLWTDVASEGLGSELGYTGIVGTGYGDLGWGVADLYWKQQFLYDHATEVRLGRRLIVPLVPRQRHPATASRSGLQSRQLHADIGVTRRGGALVADHAAGEAGEDRCQGGQPWSVRHVPMVRGGGVEGTVPENLEPN